MVHSQKNFIDEHKKYQNKQIKRIFFIFT